LDSKKDDKFILGNRDWARKKDKWTSGKVYPKFHFTKGLIMRKNKTTGMTTRKKEKKDDFGQNVDN